MAGNNTVDEDWAESIPPEAERVPAQLSIQDRQIYFHAAKHYFTGRGALIDAGTLAGGTSVALAAGALASPVGLPEAPFLHAFDLFECHWTVEDFFKHNFGGEWKHGDNFRRIYEEVVRPYAKYIQIHEGDLSKPARWDGGDIDVLGIDVWKTPQIAFETARSFFPHLREGAVVLHQDYRHIWLPWVHTMMEALSDFFEPIYCPKQGATVVFSVKQRLSLAAVEQAAEAHADPRAESALFDRLIVKLDPETAVFVNLAHILAQLQSYGPDVAKAKFDNLQIPQFGNEMDAHFKSERNVVLETIRHWRPERSGGA